MPFNHFYKVSDGTSWSDLICTKQIQIEKRSKMLEYVELATISVMHDEFNKICDDIASPNICYRKYTADSVATLDGKWKCITIREEQSNRKLILYTGGRTYPLYAAVCE